MAVSFDEYTIGAIDLDGTILHGTDDYNEAPNTTVERIIAAGRQVPSRSQTVSSAPRFTFVTTEVDRVLNGGGLFTTANNVGKEIVTAFVVYWTKKDALKHSTGADHITTTFTEGIMFPERLEWNGTFWQLHVGVIPYSETGVVDPLVYGTGSLPAFALIANTYQGGKITVNGAEVDCWQDVSLDFGVNASAKFHKGLPYATRAEITTRMPTLRINNLDPGSRSTFGEFGTRITDVELFLRHSQTTDGQRPTVVADATITHIRFDGIDGIVYPMETTGSSMQSARQGIMLGFDENATTAEIVPNYGVAIT